MKIINLKHEDPLPSRKIGLVLVSSLILVLLTYGNSKIVEGYQGE